MADLYRVPNEDVFDGIVINREVNRPADIRAIERIETTERDIVLASYPRSGSTWLSQILVYILADEYLDETKERELMGRLFMLDLYHPYNTKSPSKAANDHYGERRILKTHLYMRHIYKQIQDNKAKVIVVMRNPKDMLVSYYYFYRLNNVYGNFRGSFGEFFRLFKAKRLVYGDWLEYNRDYWSLKNKPNVLFLVYEDMVDNLPPTVRTVANFIGKNLDNDAVKSICKQTDIQYMRQNTAFRLPDALLKSDGDNEHIRQGKVGTWRDVMTQEQSNYVDLVYGKEIAKLGLPVRYDLKAKL